MKQKIIIANWKMNGSKNFAKEIIFHFLEETNITNYVGLAVPFVYLDYVSSLIKDSYINLGSQDVSGNQEYGAYTGEVNAKMLLDFNVKFTIIGHSERRNYFNEDNEILIKKLNNLLSVNIIPILCIGENLTQREENITNDILRKQLSIIDNINCEKIIIAYEPLWAIGTGKTAEQDQIYDAHQFINNELQKKNNIKSFHILYGGSANSKNAKAILSIDYVDGLLVGGASLDWNSFISMISINS